MVDWPADTAQPASKKAWGTRVGYMLGYTAVDDAALSALFYFDFLGACSTGGDGGIRTLDTVARMTL